MFSTDEYSVVEKPLVKSLIKVKDHQPQWLAGGYDLEIFRGGYHSGYLVDSGFFVQCLANAIAAVVKTPLE